MLNKKKIKRRKHLWYLKNKRKQRLHTRLWRRNNPGRCKVLARKSKYGITEEQYNKMLLQQKGKCAICCLVMVVPFVDHNHSTNEIRELLCRRRNTFLGFSMENIKVLTNAIKYLRKHNGCPALSR